jgi:chromosomal replication initiation ATPase DnaA
MFLPYQHPDLAALYEGLSNRDKAAINGHAESIRRILRGQYTASSGPANRVIEYVAEVYGFNADDLCGSRRHHDLTNARHVAMYICNEELKLSHSAIGRALGGRHRTTVLYAVGAVTDQMAVDKRYASQVRQLVRDVRAYLDDKQPTLQQQPTDSDHLPAIVGAIAQF